MGNRTATNYSASSIGDCNYGDIIGIIDTAAAEVAIYDGSNDMEYVIK